jgi:hypothetical protein
MFVLLVDHGPMPGLPAATTVEVRRGSSRRRNGNAARREVLVTCWDTAGYSVERC